MKNRFINASRKTLLSLSIAAAATTAMADGTLEGRISDHTGQVFFDGAIVRIQGTHLEKVTDDAGRFRFNSLPPGKHRLEVLYVGADPITADIIIKDGQTTFKPVKIGEQVALIDNVIVVGQAAGALSAINKMRAADNLVSIVTSDSIGQFPDENVTEALQRINGVFIERDQGEGRFVGVRGIDPRLNVASINGLNIPAPENDLRNVALDVIPSDLVESLEVTKTLTPDQDADAIGGTINIKSLSAFDRKGRSYKLNGQGFYNDLEDDNGHKFSGTFTDVFSVGGGELGLAISASTAEKNFGSDNLEADGSWEEEDGIRYHEELEMRDYRVTRERDGIAMNLDFRASDTDSYYLRTLYSKFGDQEYRNRIEFKLDEGDVSYDENSLTALGTEMEKELKNRFEEQEITSILLGGENIIDNWTFEYSLGYSEASEEEPDALYSTFVYKDVGFAGYSSLGQVPDIFYSNDGLLASNYELDEISVENNYTEDKATAVRLDIIRDVFFGDNPGFIKFGGKFRTREKTRDLNELIYEDFDDAYANVPTMDQFVGNLDYSLGNIGPGISPALQEAFFYSNAGNNPACQLTTYDENGCDFILDEKGSAISSARDFEMDEDVTALYLMSRVDINRWRLVYGLRYERTDFSASGFNVREVDVSGQDDVQIEAVSYDKDYNHLLPSINLRFKAAEDLIFRAAYTQSIARPSFGDLSPTPDEIEIKEDGNDVELKVEAGNPFLEPYESQNIDLAVEYYPENLGILSAGIFYKEIDNFIFQADVSSVENPDIYTGGIAVTDVEILKPLNGQSADLYGLELGWTRQFSDLPAPFDGLLLMANATFTDSEADLGLGEDADRSNDSELPLQADTVFNFVIGYEKNGLSIRLSNAYISERVAEIDLGDSTNDLYEDEHNQVDLTVKYDITSNIQIYFNAINLNEEPNYRYYGNSRYNAQYDEIGQSFTMGITYRNF